MCVCVCVFNDLESPILDLSRNAFRTRFFKYIIYIFFFFNFETKSTFFLRVSCVFGSRWWVHLISTYDALYDMQSPIETCKAPQNNIIESI